MKCGHCGYIYNNENAARDCEKMHEEKGYYDELGTNRKIVVEKKFVVERKSDETRE